MRATVVRSRSPSPSMSEKTSAGSNAPSIISAQVSGVCSPLPEQILTKELRLTSFDIDSDEESRSATSDADEKTTVTARVPSLLYPPTQYPCHPRVKGAFSIDISQLAEALRHIATIPLLDRNVIFPWMHEFPPMYDNDGTENLEIPPPESLRSIIIIKAGGDLTKSKLKGAIDASEIVDDSMSRFRSDAEMVEGKVRHFKLQTQKFANVSDIVIYGDEDTTTCEIETLASIIIDCQHHANQGYQGAAESRNESPSKNCRFHTFILSSPFPEICEKYPELVYIDSAQNYTTHAIDMLEMEKRQISIVATPSEIAENVWVGCMMPPPYDHDFPDGEPYNILIDTQEAVEFPEKHKLRDHTCRLRDEKKYVARLQFPGSSDISMISTAEKMESVIAMCKWIYQLSSDCHSLKNQDGGANTLPEGMMNAPSNLRVYIHCLDGYSEISFLSVAYVMYTKCLPIHEALFYLHKDKRKEFYLQHADIIFLRDIQQQLLKAAKEACGESAPERIPATPPWISTLLTCLPSRITPYLYLGNLKHANQPKMLRALGIGRILSVGEPVVWPSSEVKDWGLENMMVLSGIQDDGCDSLFEAFDRALEFIGTYLLSAAAITIARSRPDH
ncbi:tyrosine/serine/threonine protein phosphatase pps1 [Ascosphaera aggregata]|nr:tyrosine/serine/threonine protein phosphatase pps1 [Ascosphaera aggregata]